MMAKRINLEHTVYQLVNQYPELAEVMKQLGFADIANKAMLNSVGKFMTIPKGAKMKRIPMEHVISVLKQNGFEIETTEDKVEEKSMQEKNTLSNQAGTASVFHGSINGVENSSFPRQAASREVYQNKMAITAELVKQQGHPLQTFTRQNEMLEQILGQMKENMDNVERLAELLVELKGISIHYAKKGDLLYPHLKSEFGIAGPSDLLWTTDDEIRDDLSKLLQQEQHDAAWVEGVASVIKRAEEMIRKDNMILFPNCAVNFSKEDWINIYWDAKDYDVCFGVESEVWEEAENAVRPSKSALENQQIVMPGGHLTVEQLTALLNTIPMEITFVDADDINCFFNEGPKVFKRPGMAIDRTVFSCHPPKFEAMARAIIDDFKSGKRDRVPVWMEKNGRTMLVTYMAVRDRNNQYVGTVELVQDMEFAKEYFAEKLDK